MYDATDGLSLGYGIIPRTLVPTAILTFWVRGHPYRHRQCLTVIYRCGRWRHLPRLGNYLPMRDSQSYISQLDALTSSIPSFLPTRRFPKARIARVGVISGPVPGPLAFIWHKTVTDATRRLGVSRSYIAFARLHFAAINTRSYSISYFLLWRVFPHNTLLFG